MPHNNRTHPPILSGHDRAVSCQNKAEVYRPVRENYSGFHTAFVIFTRWLRSIFHPDVDMRSGNFLDDEWRRAWTPPQTLTTSLTNIRDRLQNVSPQAEPSFANRGFANHEAGDLRLVRPWVAHDHLDPRNKLRDNTPPYSPGRGTHTIIYSRPENIPRNTPCRPGCPAKRKKTERILIPGCNFYDRTMLASKAHTALTPCAASKYPG